MAVLLVFLVPFFAHLSVSAAQNVKPSIYEALLRPLGSKLPSLGYENLKESPGFESSHRLIEHPLNIGLPPYLGKKGPVTVNGVSDGNAVGGEPDIKHTAGYFKLNRTHDAR